MADTTISSELRERIRAALKANPRAMLMMVAAEMGVPEAEVVRSLPDNQSCELDIGRWEELIRSFEALDKVHVICSNGAVTLEAFGQFGNFSTSGTFFNVQTASIDMHIRYKNLGAAFAVEKPGHMDGFKTISFLFFDKNGQSAFKVFLSFGAKAPTPEREAQFNAIREKFRLK